MKQIAIGVLTASLLFGLSSVPPAEARSRTEGPSGTNMTASQIFDQETAQIAELKAKLHLTPEQEKSWTDLETALRDIAKKRADRQILIQNALSQQPKGPVDLVEQWRNIADILNERSIELKTLADSAQPLYASLSDEQKKQFKDQIQRLQGKFAEGALK
ncbi:Spy/CpxP family protein refolding chaperone [Methylocapsa acidiphila]|uniref:Spy/CpxP family protein refolding chaperone n=1 Tax=Methylocapsa acidiphila TaxID=133552 RepID=UPI00047D38E6|nr:Spy/CpxP family protein refolding chaperone [Methylocapsa acidiphila]